MLYSLQNNATFNSIFCEKKSGYTAVLCSDYLVVNCEILERESFPQQLANVIHFFVIHNLPSHFHVKYSNVLRFLLSSHANTLRLASLRGGTTWQSSAAENHSSPMTDPSSSHCAKGMYSKLGAPTRRSRELKTKYLFERSEFILLRLARRKVGQVVNEALTFCFVLGQAKMKIQDKHIRARQYKTNSVSNIKYSESPIHMTKVEPQKLYPNTCVYTRCLNGIESELSHLPQPLHKRGAWYTSTSLAIPLPSEGAGGGVILIHPHLRLRAPLLGGAGGGGFYKLHINTIQNEKNILTHHHMSATKQYKRTSNYRLGSSPQQRRTS